MDIRVQQQKTPLKGTVQAPPSKSYTHRASIVAAMGKERVIIENPNLCEDNLATLRVLTDLGARIIVEGSDVPELIRRGIAKPI